MNSRNLSLLGLLAIVVLAAALWLTYPRSSDQKSTLLYPDLKGELTKVTAIRIHAAGGTGTVELSRGESQWNVAERANYPADAGKVRRLLQALADAKVIEEKTSNPANYAALGVEDLSDAAATGARVELVGTGQAVDLIVGKNAGMKGSYVRRSGESASWLTSESIEASTKPQDWLSTSLIDVGADRVRSAHIAIDASKPYSVAKQSRADADFRIEGLPKGSQGDSFAANNLATALAGLTLADVRPAQDFAGVRPQARATFDTFDGLVVSLDGWSKDGKHYVAVKTTYDPALAAKFHVEARTPEQAPATEGTAPKAPLASTENVEKAASETHARLQGWVYEIAEYKYEAIFKPAESLTRKE